MSENRYYNSLSANMLLGALYKNPILFESPSLSAISEEDFMNSMQRLAYSIMYNLYSMGHSKFNQGIIESYLVGRSAYDFYNTEVEVGEDNEKTTRGEYFFRKLDETGEESSLEPSIEIMKKMTLLRNLEMYGVSVKRYYDWETKDQKIASSQKAWLEKTSLTDMANEISDDIDIIMDSASNGSIRESVQAGEGILDLIASFQEEPNYGSPFPIEKMNTITRGARLGKFYLRSAPTGGGKSRLMMADMCSMAINKIYHHGKKEWIDNGIQEGALFISTELDIEECQTLALAFITGIDEDIILDGVYDDDQKRIIQEGAEIMLNSPLYFELIPDFSIRDIESSIRLYYREKDVKYFGFDYIHTSMKFLAEIAKISNGMKLREDQILFMLSTKLKELATTLNVFIESSTQLNGDYLEATELNQNLLRGAKSIADRLDVGMISTKIRPIDEEVVESFVNAGLERPNYIISFYKIRRGKLAGHKLWCKADLGTCRVRGLFVTTSNDEPIDVKNVVIKVKEDKNDNKSKNSAF